MDNEQNQNEATTQERLDARRLGSVGSVEHATAITSGTVIVDVV